MSLFPLEIIDLVVHNLDQRELLQCLTVSRAWYRLALRVLYRNIRLFLVDETQKFIMAITTYPNARDSLVYVEEFEFNELFGDKCFDVLPVLSKDTDLLPNIRRLTISNWTQIPHREYVQLFFAYRSTLSHLALRNDHYSVLKEDYHGLSGYLGAFPHLTHLLLELAYSRMMEILPLVTSDLEVLKIESSHITNEGMLIIKHRYRRLRELVLTADRYMERDISIIDALLSMQHLAKMNFTLYRVRNNTLVDLLLTALKYVGHPPVHSNHLIIESCRSECPLFAIQVDTHCKKTAVSIKIRGAFDLYDVLSMAGDRITKLDIGGHCPFDLDKLHDVISDSLPYLRWLELSISSAKLNLCTVKVFNDITSLSMHFCLSDQQKDTALIRQIEGAFPHLQRMEILFHVPHDVMQGHQQYVLQLPELHITDFCIRGRFSYRYSIIVVKERQGVVSRVWKMNSSHKTYPFQEYTEHFDQVLEQSSQPVLILKSTTIRRLVSQLS